MKQINSAPNRKEVIVADFKMRSKQKDSVLMLSIQSTQRNPSPAVRNHSVHIHWEKEITMGIEKLLRNRIIRPSESPLVLKNSSNTKSYRKLRVCIDYRPMNRITVKDRYHILRIDDILNALGK